MPLEASKLERAALDDLALERAHHEAMHDVVEFVRVGVFGLVLRLPVVVAIHVACGVGSHQSSCPRL